MIVVTANFGGHDEPRRLPDGVRGKLHTDATVVPDGWEILGSPLLKYPPRLAARYCKVWDFDGKRLTLWHDAQFHLTADPSDWVRGMLGDADVALFAHPHRKCAYAEAEECLRLRRGDPDQIRAQVERYRADGFPENFGLWATGVLLRRWSTKMLDLAEAWWEEVERSERDQVSLPYCLWKLGITPRTIAGNVYAHPVAVWHGHKR